MKCRYCGTSLKEVFSERISINEHSLSPVVSQEVFFVGEDDSVYCPPDEEGIPMEHEAERV